jgi:hypothetical protein
MDYKGYIEIDMDDSQLAEFYGNRALYGDMMLEN